MAVVTFNSREHFKLAEVCNERNCRYRFSAYVLEILDRAKHGPRCMRCARILQTLIGTKHFLKMVWLVPRSSSFDVDEVPRNVGTLGTKLLIN